MLSYPVLHYQLTNSNYLHLAQFFCLKYSQIFKSYMARTLYYCVLFVHIYLAETFNSHLFIVIHCCIISLFFINNGYILSFQRKILLPKSFIWILLHGCSEENFILPPTSIVGDYRLIRLWGKMTAAMWNHFSPLGIINISIKYLTVRCS